MVDADLMIYDFFEIFKKSMMYYHDYPK